MKLSNKIPVPELDELQVARMERSIVAKVAALPPKEAPAGHSLRNAAVGFVAVAGVVLAIFLNLRASQVPLLGQPWTRGEPAEIVTGPGQSSSLVLGDARVEIGESTRVAVQRYSDGRTTLHLASGTVNCEVEPRPNRPTFQVLSGDVTVTVVGTAFEVSRTRIVDVKVERGIVSVETSHEELKLHAGDSWQGSPFADTSLAMLLDASKDPLAVGTLAEATNPTGTATSSKRNGHGNEKNPKNTRNPKNPKNTRPIKADKTIKLSEVLLSAKPLPPIYKQSYSDALTKLKEVSAQNPRTAVQELESFAARATGSEASFALYSRAYLLFFKLKNHSQVIKTAKQYSRRFPRGAEAEDMLWLRVRASCAANEFSSCRAAAHTYLRRYPKGIFQGLASKIITTTKTE
jgi:hypothetical protein